MPLRVPGGMIDVVLCIFRLSFTKDRVVFPCVENPAYQQYTVVSSSKHAFLIRSCRFPPSTEATITLAVAFISHFSTPWCVGDEGLRAARVQEDGPTPAAPARHEQDASSETLVMAA